MQRPTANSSDTNAHIAKHEGDVADGLVFDPESEQRVRQKWQLLRCYGFECGNFRLIAPLNTYCEVLTQAKIEELPNTPEHFLGLCNVRGNLIPVYQIETLLGQKAPPTKYVLVIGNLDRAAALVVGAKPKPFDLRDFEPLATTPELPELMRPAVSTSYRRDDDTWHLIKHTELFQTLATLSPVEKTSLTI